MKNRKILKVISEYQKLIEKRTTINDRIEKIYEELGFGDKHCENLEEYLEEVDKRSEKMQQNEDIFAKGQENITSLSEDELLTFKRLEEIKVLQEQEFYVSAEILAIRQGIMNITDINNSHIDEKLNEKYMNVQEFVEFSSMERLVDFLKAYNRNSKEKIPDLPDDNTVKEIIVRPEFFLETIHEKQLHPILQTFVNKLIQTNEKTGYTSGKYQPQALDFSTSELEGEVLIENAKAKISTRSIAEAATAKELTVNNFSGWLKRFLEKGKKMIKGE